MFTIPLVFKALLLLGLGVALVIPCFTHTCGDPMLRFRDSAENIRLYWIGLAAGLVLIGGGLAVSVAASNEVVVTKPSAGQPAAKPATESASYSGG